MTQTEEIVAGMLTEYTGRHMLDSGGIYGRNYERNQGRNFKDEPRCTIDFRYGTGVTINLYHWLVDKLEYWPEMQDEYDEYSKDSDESYLHDMEGFAEYLNEKKGYDGYRNECSDNSYNSENLLSQTIQFNVICHPDGDSIILLQIHGGCDVRGGYTAPKVFKPSRHCDEWYGFTDYRSATIFCTNEKCRARWRTDDAYHWYFEDCEGEADDAKDLDKYTEVKHGNTHADAVIEAPTKGILYVDEEHNGHCPVCAAGKLDADWY